MSAQVARQADWFVGLFTVNVRGRDVATNDMRLQAGPSFAKRRGDDAEQYSDRAEPSKWRTSKRSADPKGVARCIVNIL